MDSQRKALILCASLATVGTASFAIYQLTRILFSVVRDSEFEATKLLASVTAQIQSDSPDIEIPEELELDDDLEEVYSYGSLQELYFRRSLLGDTDWEWSFDRDEWYSTAELTPNHSLILDPPSIIFITRLHLTSVARRKAAAADSSTAGSSRQAARIPPPVELPDWAKLQQQLQQQSDSVPSSSSHTNHHAESVNGAKCNSSSSHSCSNSVVSSQIIDHSSQQPSSSSNRSRRLDDAPELLCCPITGQIMLQPVTLPSGKTFEYEAIRRWISQHGTDPTTGQTPVSLHEVHPNLLVREMVEKWLAGLDPLAEHVDGA